MKKSFQYLAFSTALILGVNGSFTQAAAETLYESVYQAVTTHPSVRAADAAVEAGAQSVREERSGYFPELSANATGGRIFGDNSTSRGLSVTRGTGYSWLWEGSASATQKLFDWGETGNKVSAARARVKSADNIVASTQEAVALKAAQAYVALLRASHLKTEAAENLETISEYRDRIAVQVREGGADESELNRANDFHLLAQNAATEFQGAFQQALADYVEAVGGSPETSLKRPFLPASFPQSMEAAIDQAFITHPQVMAARDAVIALDHDMRAEKTSYLPKVSGQLSYLKRDQDDVIGGEATDTRALMKMDWAYSTGGAQHARVGRAEHLREQAKAELEETYRQVEHGIRVAWSTLDIARQQKETQEGRKAATANVVETYQAQYEGGKRSLVELMQAESQAFDASVAYANADYGVLGSTYALLAAGGQLLSALEPVTMQAPLIDPIVDVEAPQAVEAEILEEDLEPAAGGSMLVEEPVLRPVSRVNPAMAPAMSEPETMQYSFIEASMSPALDSSRIPDPIVEAADHGDDAAGH